MYTPILIAVVLGFLFMLLISWDNGFGRHFDFGESLSAFCFAGFFGFIIGLLVMAWMDADREWNQYTHNIESLEDGSQMSGSFFLGCGGFGSSMKYTFYHETDKGRYKLKQLYASDVEIEYIEDGSKPRAVKYIHEYTDAPINDWASDGAQNSYWVIHVPKGTIKNNYNLDTK